MGIWDTFGDKLNEAGNTIVNKTKTFGKSIELESEINSCRKQMQDIFSKLGIYVYEKGIKSDDETYTEYISQLDMLTNTIVDLQNKIDEIKNKRICPGCGNEIEGEPAFCPNCGRPVNISQVQAEKGICHKCGAELKENAAFCASCGAKVEK